MICGMNPFVFFAAVIAGIYVAGWFADLALQSRSFRPVGRPGEQT